MAEASDSNQRGESGHGAGQLSLALPLDKLTKPRTSRTAGSARSTTYSVPSSRLSVRMALWW
jgi:hypothetical protein